MGVGHSGWRGTTQLKVLNYYYWIFGLITGELTFRQNQQCSPHILNNFCIPFSFQAKKKSRWGYPLQGHLTLEILPTGIEKRADLYIALSEEQFLNAYSWKWQDHMPKNLMENINYEIQAKRNPWFHPDLKGVGVRYDRGIGGNH